MSTLFGRPIVKTWREVATHTVVVVNDEGKEYRLSDEQLRQMYQVGLA